MRRTKIVCTLGPATSDLATIEALIRAGMDTARINMSHGDHEGHRALVRMVREAASVTNRPVAILADLQGPKIRVGRLPGPVELVPGAALDFVPEGHPDEEALPTTYANLASDLEPGDQVLLDDGLLELECTRIEGDRASFRVVRGGVLSSGKGINIPSGNLSAASMTPKDHEDLDFALGEKVEFIGLSFVRRAQDVEELRQKVDGRALVVAKMEMARAMGAMEEILAVTDMTMVARGDLGVELPFEEVPLAQKRIIQRANFHARPVITATQMLESMIENPRPTRAEASDVANAVLDGTDAVMLSGETAVGKYPIKAVEALVRIIREIEASGVLEKGPRYLQPTHHRQRKGATSREHAVASATVDAVKHLDAPAILTITRSGFSARLVSSHRPTVPIFAVTTDPQTFRELAAVWGVRPVLAGNVEVSYESLTDFGKRAILESGLGAAGDSVLVTAGFPFHQPGTTNTMRVEHL
ncbi:MAG: pyruvate kinase [Gemmatimonadales bacterium]|nr:MAG: pyruvate kinase [Gemmatimonadales bacterium]